MLMITARIFHYHSSYIVLRTFHISLRSCLAIHTINLYNLSLCLSIEDVSNEGRIEEDVRKLVERLNPDKPLFDRLMSKGVLSVEEYNALIEVNQDKENLLKILSRVINTRRTFNSFLAVLIESDQYFRVIDATGTKYIRRYIIHSRIRSIRSLVHRLLMWGQACLYEVWIVCDFDLGFILLSLVCISCYQHTKVVVVVVVVVVIIFLLFYNSVFV